LASVTVASLASWLRRLAPATIGTTESASSPAGTRHCFQDPFDIVLTSPRPRFVT
jgi:hypothetical protein